MVTKEEFEHFIAEFESFRDVVLEELSKSTNKIEKIEDDLKELKEDLKIKTKKLN